MALGVLFSPETKRYPVEVSALAPGGATLSVWLQAVSDFEANPDHHARIYVNGTLVGESRWDGKKAQRVDVELLPGAFHEGDNVLELENVGDTGAAYSMVMLDRYAVEYTRLAAGSAGSLEGRWTQSGGAELSGFAAGAHVLDTSGAQPTWLSDAAVGTGAMPRSGPMVCCAFAPTRENAISR